MATIPLLCLVAINMLAGEQDSISRKITIHYLQKVSSREKTWQNLPYVQIFPDT